MSHPLRLSTFAVACILVLTACSGGTDSAGDDTIAGDTHGDTGDTSPDTGDTPPDTNDTLTDTDDTPPDTDDTSPDADATSDTEPDVDNTCDPACGANQSCADPLTDTCECNEGYADCNGDPSDGCETDLSQPETCGHCAPGDQCDAFGIEPVCQVGEAGQPGYCDPTHCREGYSDLDGEASTGCETGFVRLQTSPTNLSSAIGAGIDQLVVDQNGTLFALEVASTVKVHAIEVDEQGVPGVADSEDLLFPAADGSPSLAVSDGLLAVTRQGAMVVYEYANGQLITVREQSLPNAMSVTAITPQLDGSRAEFVAGAAGGLTWYAVYDKDSEPAELTCFASELAASVVLCRVATNTNLTNARLLTSGAIGSGNWVVAVGDSTVEFEPDAGTPASLKSVLVTGTAIDAGVVSIQLLPNNRLAVLDSDTLTVLDYTLDAANFPTNRTESLSHTLSGPATSLALLDESRVAVGTDSGVEVVLINGNGPRNGMLSGVTNAVTALAADDTHLYIATGSSLAVWQKELGPVE